MTPARGFAPSGSCAAETNRLESHVARPSALQLGRAKDQVRRDGYGKVFVSGPVVHSQLLGAYTPGSSVNAGDFAVKLDAIREAGARSLLVVLDSPGGDVRDGLGIVRAMQRFSSEAGPVVVHVAGAAASMGCCVAVAADFVVADPWSSSFFVHPVSGGEAPEREILDQSLFDLLRARTLLDPQTLADWIDGEVEFSAHDAVARGFADELGDFQRAHEIAAGSAQPGGLTTHAPRTFRQQVLAERLEEARLDRRWKGD